MSITNCHICDYENDTSQDGLFCVICGADFSNPGSESKIMENKTRGTYATSDKISDLRKEAFIYLTNQRLVLVPADVEYQGLGMTGALTAAVAQTIWSSLTSGQPSLISIKLKDVKTIRDGKFGLLVKALIVETTDGHMVKFTAPKIKEWKGALTKAAGI